MLAAVAMLFLSAGPMDRPTFARSLARVQHLMTKAQVRDVLGSPDDVISEPELTGYSWLGGETWCYGVDDHGGFPTLGFVHFSNGRVYDKEGPTSTQPRLIEESKLRPLLRVLNTTWPSNAREDDPLSAYRIALALQPLGKDAALDTLAAFCDASPGRAIEVYELHSAAMGLMFDVDQKQKSLFRGKPFEVQEIADDLLALGLPLTTRTRGMGGGYKPSIADHLAFYRLAGKLKPQVHIPSDPLGVPERVADPTQQERLRRAIRALLRTCVRFDPEEPTDWAAFKQEVEKRKPVWSDKDRCYVVKGVKPIEYKEVLHKQWYWQPKELADLDFRVLVDCRQGVCVTERWSPDASWTGEFTIEQLTPFRRTFSVPKQGDFEQSFYEGSHERRSWPNIQTAATCRIVLRDGRTVLTSPTFAVPSRS